MSHPSEISFSGTERYVVKRQLGEGAMGVVYEAVDLERKTRIALKTLRHTNAKALYRFKREFRALQDIEHANLVRLGELVSRDGLWFFTMEYIEGVDFISHIRSSDEPGVDSYNEPALRSCAPQLAAAIQALHQAGKIHRDIKPSNVLVTTEGRVVLLDFGLVAEFASGEESTGTNMVGTAAYMAPEQAWAKAGPPADWYSFGAILYQALTGRRPHEGKGAIEILMKKQQYAPAPPRAIVPSVPADLDQLCCDLLKQAADSRPAGTTVLERLGIVQSHRTDQRKLSVTSIGDAQPFVGRKDELAMMQQAFDDAANGAVTVFVHGQSGVGRSELVRHFTDQVVQKHRDVVVLRGRCYERESVPYKAFDGVADSLSRYMVQLPNEEATALLPLQADLLPELFPVLQRVEAIARAPKNRQDERMPHLRRVLLYKALRELFLRLVMRHPVILVIDDIQWADADSMTLLDELMHPPEEPRLLLLITCEQGDADDELTRLVPGETRHIHLSSLPAEGARKLVELLAPGLQDPAVVEAIIAEAGGHPLFIHELVLFVREEGTATRATLDEALWTRIGRLDDNARKLVEVLAIAGSPVTHQIAAHAAEFEFLDYEKASGLLRVAQLARRSRSATANTIELCHDRIGDTILGHLSDGRRRYLHKRLAISLERGGAQQESPEALVDHLEAAGDDGDAAGFAEEAAARANKATAFDQAAELYQTALRLGNPQGENKRRLSILLGEALVNAGRGQEAADVFLEALEGADRASRLECRRQAAEQLLICGYYERGVRELGALLAEIGLSIPGTPVRALVSLLTNRARLRLRGLKWTERPASQIAPEDLIRLDVYNAVSHGLGLVDNIRGADYNTRYALLALKTGEVTRVVRALSNEAVFQASQGKRGIRRGREIAKEVRRLVERYDQPEIQWRGIMIEAALDYFAGRFSHARDLLARAVELFGQRVRGTRWELNNSRLFWVFCLKHTGGWVELQQLAEQFIRDARRRGDRYQETSLVYYKGFLYLAADRPDAVEPSFTDATWTPPKGTFHLQHWFRLESRSELAFYEGSANSRFDELQHDFWKLKRSLLTRIQIVRVTANKLRGGLLLAHARENATKRSSLFRQVGAIVSQLEKEGVGYALVFGLLLRAALAVATDDRTSAINSLEKAAAEAERWQMKLFAAAARYCRGELLGGDDGAELIKRATTAMNTEQVVDPARLCRTLVPGWE